MMKLFSAFIIILISGCANVGSNNGMCDAYTYGKADAELRGLVYLSGQFEAELRAKLPSSDFDVDVCWYTGQGKLTGRTKNRPGGDKSYEFEYIGFKWFLENTSDIIKIEHTL